MNRLFLFRIACLLLFLVCAAALFIEIFVNDINSLTAIYLWAGLTLLSLSGIIAGAFSPPDQKRKEQIEL